MVGLHLLVGVIVLGTGTIRIARLRADTPLARNHQLGDTEHAEGGELITWVNDKCYFTTHGVTTFGLLQTSRVCKDPPKPETDLFKDMRKKLDEGAKGRAP